MYKIALVAAGGAAGSVARYLTSGLAQRLSSAGFPIGTFTVNMLGCLLFGLVWSALEDRLGLSPQLRLLLLTGFMGAFTTFSTFAFESAELLKHSQYWWLAANVAGQTLLGLTLMLTGLALGRLL